MITPAELQAQYPCREKAAKTVAHARQQIIDILNGKDDRLLVIIGPCSIHNVDAARLYTEKLTTQIKKYDKTLCIIMRAYIEKSRTSVGWKGLINDPHLNQTHEIHTGLSLARSLLIDINNSGVPTATEIVSPFTAPYFLDLTSWAVIGARTTESPIYRELASHLAMPVGFKNNTDGNVQIAIDAVQTAQQPHHFLGLDLSGKTAMITSKGNPYAHVVLRGAKHKPNYDTYTIEQTTSVLKKLNSIHRVMIDCSHGNSQKDHLQQIQVIDTIAKRLKNGDKNCFGVMIESYLKSGKQSPYQSQLDPEQSITDACISWDETERVLAILSEAVYTSDLTRMAL